MITRIWHGRTNLEKADGYRRFLTGKGTAEYLETQGNISVKVWTKQEKDCVHCWTVTEWDNIDSIKAFAGEAYEKAKYYPEDHGVLLEFEETVEHYISDDVSNVKVRNYMTQLAQNYEGGNWLGQSFISTLQDVNVESAFRQSFPGAQSVAAIVGHCTYWRNVLIAALNSHYSDPGRPRQEPTPLSPETLRNRDWTSLLSDLAQTHEILLEKMSDLRDNALQNEYAPGHTLDHLISATIYSDVYYLGQMAMLSEK
jgi:heme-degrading monooxygenase HmoA